MAIEPMTVSVDDDIAPWSSIKDKTRYAKEADNVNHPAHYQANGLETIDVIEAWTKDLDGIVAVCTANVIKYISRWHKKNGVEDLKKRDGISTNLSRF